MRRFLGLSGLSLPFLNGNHHSCFKNVCQSGVDSALSVSCARNRIKNGLQTFINYRILMTHRETLLFLRRTIELLLVMKNIVILLHVLSVNNRWYHCLPMFHCPVQLFRNHARLLKSEYTAAAKQGP